MKSFNLYLIRDSEIYSAIRSGGCGRNELNEKLPEFEYASIKQAFVAKF